MSTKKFISKTISLYPFCHSGLDPESSLSIMDSRFHGNDVQIALLMNLLAKKFFTTN